MVLRNETINPDIHNQQSLNNFKNTYIKIILVLRLQLFNVILILM